MKIRIYYKIWNELEKYVDLTAEEYFDSLDEDVNFEDEGITKFDHAVEYLKIPTSTLDWTEIQLTETKIGKSIRTQFFDEGKSWMCHIKKLSGYEEIIISSQLDSSNTHISRIHKKNEQWQVNYNGVITDLADNSQKEKLIF